MNSLLRRKMGAVSEASLFLPPLAVERRLFVFCESVTMMFRYERRGIGRVRFLMEVCSLQQEKKKTQ